MTPDTHPQGETKTKRCPECDAIERVTCSLEYCPKTHLKTSGEPKTNEEIVNEYCLFELMKSGNRAEDFENIDFETDDNKLILKLMSLARASGRAQVTAEQKNSVAGYLISLDARIRSAAFKSHDLSTFDDAVDVEKAISIGEALISQAVAAKDEEYKKLSEHVFFGRKPIVEIPQCLQECRLTSKELLELPDQHSPDFLLAFQNKQLEKFSLLLLQRDEAHKAEVGDFIGWQSRKFLRDEIKYDGHGNYWIVFVRGNAYGKKLTHSELFDLFLKDKEGRNA